LQGVQGLWKTRVDFHGAQCEGQDWQGLLSDAPIPGLFEVREHGAYDQLLQRRKGQAAQEVRREGSEAREGGADKRLLRTRF